jgi:hypothetical protein
MSNPTPVEPAPPRPVSGWYVLLGLVLGVAASPLAVLAGFSIWNLFDPMCSGGGGAEDSLSCTLRTVTVMILSVPFGAVIGLIVTLRVARRRMAVRG